MKSCDRASNNVNQSQKLFIDVFLRIVISLARPYSNHILFLKMIERLKEAVAEFAILTNHRGQLEVFLCV